MKKYNYKMKKCLQIMRILIKWILNNKFMIYHNQNYKFQRKLQNFYIKALIKNKGSCTKMAINTKEILKIILNKVLYFYLGKGVYIYANGNKYEGEWRNNQKHGLGILQF